MWGRSLQYENLNPAWGVLFLAEARKITSALHNLMRFPSKALPRNRSLALNCNDLLPNAEPPEVGDWLQPLARTRQWF